LSTTTPKRWIDRPVMPPGQRDRFSHLYETIVQILYNRNIRQPEQVRAFMAQDAPLHDPFQLKGIDAAVERITQAIQDGERVAVYGDFDADGVTSTALLTQTLQALGTTVAPYIPDRVDEGYGLNTDALDNLASRGANLIVTVDCGIRSADEVAYGKHLGLDIIVTDHHSIGPELPPAQAVINPKQPGCGYPFKGLAGVGVAFKLAQALLETLPLAAGNRISLHKEHLLDLVALGTVADIVPLLDENRSLVQRGLAQLNAPRRKGIQALMEKAGVKPGYVNSTAIGFMLGPRINAAGRLQSAMLAYYLLMTRNPSKASHYADQLNRLNQERQQLTLETTPEFHITRALDECTDLLARHGGHAAAAGFTVHNENLPTLQERLQAIAQRELAEANLVPKLEIDAELTLGPGLSDLYEQLTLLQPFGEANPAPVFVSYGLRVGRRQAIGSDGQHLKLTVSDGRAWWDAIAFRRGKEADKLPDHIDLAYQLDMNEWSGGKRLQLVVQDWRPAS